MIHSLIHLRALRSAAPKDPLALLRRRPLAEQLAEDDRLGLVMRSNVVRMGVPGMGRPRVTAMEVDDDSV